MQILPIVIGVLSAAGGAMGTYAFVEHRAKVAFKQVDRWRSQWKIEHDANETLQRAMGRAEANYRAEVSSLKLRLATFEEKAKITSEKRRIAGRLGAAVTSARAREKRAAAVAKTIAALPSLVSKEASA